MPEPAGLEPAPPEIKVGEYTRKKRGRKVLPEHLPRVEVMHEISKDEKVCACGCMLSRIGEEVSVLKRLQDLGVRIISKPGGYSDEKTRFPLDHHTFDLQ
jgi:hypothetical protein